MNFVKCFDVAEMVIDEAAKRFNPLWILNTESFETFRQYCSVIDSISDKVEAEALTVSVDEISLQLEITLSCNNNLNVNFVFPSLWDKVSIQNKSKGVRYNGME